MYLSSLRVFDYKSILDSGNIEFKQGINIIVGQNNVGKTALLEALSLRIENFPHRSPKTKTTRQSNIKEKSRINFQIFFSSEEAKELIRRNKGELRVDPPQNVSTDSLNLSTILKDLNIWFKDGIKLAGTSISEPSELFGLTPIPPYEIEDVSTKDYQSRGKARKSQLSLGLAGFENGEFNRISQGSAELYLNPNTLKSFLNNIYRFAAQRINLAASLPAEKLELDSDGSNLAGVLANLISEERNVFEELKDYVSYVIPSIKDFTSVRRQSKQGMGFEYQIEISMWEPQLRRSDLRINLADAGSGVGQVIALLYVIITSEHPKVILIDEIQTFLHPGAVKRLLEIFNKEEFSLHQYIITTHSPEVVSNANPSNVIMIDIEDGISTISHVNLSDSSMITRLFTSLDITLGDFFFCDHIIWVEGETEQAIIPQLIKTKHLNVFILRSGLIYQRRKENIKLACELVKKLSQGDNVFRPSTAIIFDKEDLTDSQMIELTELGGNVLHFLPRKMIENYFFHPSAIAEKLNQILIEAGSDNININAKTVNKWLKARELEGWLDINKPQNSISKGEWIKEVHGSNLLNQLFKELTDNRCEYISRKKQYGLDIVNWLIENDPQFLKDLKIFYETFIN